MTKSPPPIPESRRPPRRALKAVVAVLILLAGAAIAVIAFKTKPEVAKQEKEKKLPVVEVVQAETESITTSLPSQGLIEPRKKTTVAAEVGGKVSWVSPKFKAGGEFEKGEDLVRVDRADYDAAVVRAEAAQAEAELALQTEQAKAEVAKNDWIRLGRTEEASDFTLRIPHVAQAEKRKQAAEAEVAKAIRDLDRTTIIAPFTGRLDAIHTELGAYLLPGGPVAGIYTTAPYEVRLPLSLDDWTLLERGEDGNPVGKVSLNVNAGGENHEWNGSIVRSEGLVERESRSIYVVAEFGGDETDPSASLIQPGLFVNARIDGKTMDGVISVPVRAFRDLEQVMVIGKEDLTVHFRKVKILRRGSGEVLVRAGRNGKDGIESGDWLSVTELADVIDGETKVSPPENVLKSGQSLTGEPTPKP